MKRDCTIIGVVFSVFMNLSVFAQNTELQQELTNITATSISQTESMLPNQDLSKLISLQDIEAIKGKLKGELKNLTNKQTAIADRITKLKGKRQILLQGDFTKKDLQAVNEKIDQLGDKLNNYQQSYQQLASQLEKVEAGQLSFDQLQALNTKKISEKYAIKEEKIERLGGDITGFEMPDRQGLMDRLFIEGDFVLNTRFYDLSSISSIVGYTLSDKIQFGLGGSYMPQFNQPNLPTQSWGSRMMTRLNVNEKVFIQAENWNSFSSLNGENLPTGNLLGLGFRMPKSLVSSNLNMMMLYNLGSSQFQNTYGNLNFKLGYQF